MLYRFLPLFMIGLFTICGCETQYYHEDEPTSETEVNGSVSEHDHGTHDSSIHSENVAPGTTDGEMIDGDHAVPGTTDGEAPEIKGGEAPAGTTSGLTTTSTLTVASADEPIVPLAAPQQPIRRAQRALERQTNRAVQQVGQGVEKVENTAKAAVEKTEKVVGVSNQNKPRLFALLPDYIHNPDGMTVSDDQKTIFMCCPNFNGRPNNEGPKDHGSFLVSFDLKGNMTKLLEFPILEETGQTGAMGLDFGPDGNLYVCDNQYFFNKDHKSRILRVVMNGKKPTGEVQVVITGLKLPNAILWMKDKLLFTDTFLDLEGKFGSGGLWMFTKDEILKAGTKDNPAITVKPNGTDSHLIVIEEVEKIGRGDNGGADGMTCTPDGTVYFGNFGDGAMYRIAFDANNKATCEKIHKAGEVFECCDGIFYDKRTDKIYINDSQKNAIRAFKPVKAGEKPKFELVWENGDTDGKDGLLDQPCECVVIGRRMIICNFDWPFPGLLNSAYDKVNTMSVITLP